MNFPIYCSCEGPDFGKPAIVRDLVSGVTKEYVTSNPIPEGTKFVVQYGGYAVRFELDSHYYSNPNLSVVKVLNVMGKSCPESVEVEIIDHDNG